MENIELTVKKVIAERLGVNQFEIQNTESFADDLGADSLDMTELVMFLEATFNLEISDEDSEKMLIVQDMIDYIAARQNK
ncbi:MAG: acyl carrier protein [Alcaligenaceae bacterium]|nr:acyl carrier protein [Alcaligenaceae bacterium]